MAARIYQPAKTAMQQGLAATREWILEYEPEQPKLIEPLMGWTSSTETKPQVRMSFASKRGGGRLRHAPGHCLPCRGAAKDGAETEVLRRELQVRPAGPLDALTVHRFGL